MQITFLGTGTSQGVPFIGCTCEVCTSTDPRDNRLRSSVWIRDNDNDIIIDTGPDFRYQMLRAQVSHINAVMFTHGHKDHVAGLDDIRAYNYWQNEAIDLYANASTTEVLKRDFYYAFSGDNYPGIPALNLHTIDGDSSFTIGSLVITPIRVMHYKMEVLGFRIGDFSYITDANYIASDQLKKLHGSKVLVINALRHEKHISHFTLEEAIKVAGEVNAGSVYFTHASHQLGLHRDIEKMLPANMHMAFDGMQLTL